MCSFLFYHFCFHFTQCVEYQKQDYAAIQMLTGGVSHAAMILTQTWMALPKLTNVRICQWRCFHTLDFSTIASLTWCESKINSFFFLSPRWQAKLCVAFPSSGEVQCRKLTCCTDLHSYEQTQSHQGPGIKTSIFTFFFLIFIFIIINGCSAKA